MRKFFLLLALAGFIAPGCHQAVLRSARQLVSPEKVRFLEEAIFFGFDEWRLQADPLGDLIQKAEMLRRYKNLSVVLEGHTDWIGPAEYNLQLGDRRARQVKLELVKMGVSPGRLSVVSFGETRPRGMARSAAALRANRRVEFRLR